MADSNIQITSLNENLVILYVDDGSEDNTFHTFRNDEHGRDTIYQLLYRTYTSIYEEIMAVWRDTPTIAYSTNNMCIEE